ncbi:MAG: VWA domain-containing protein [Pyrinomonadaceae bacterium]
MPGKQLDSKPMESKTLLNLSSFVVALIIITITIGSLKAQEDQIKIFSELVNIDVVVKDRSGQRIKGLQKSDFDLEEDGVRQEITHFRAAERPLKIVLLFDTSFSMQDVLPVLKQEASKLVGGMTQEDRLMIASFDCSINRHTIWVDRDHALEATNGITPGPLLCHHVAYSPPTPRSTSGVVIADSNTYVYEAFRDILERFQDGSESIAILAFTDGLDTATRFASNRQKRAGLGEEMAKLAEESWVTVFPVHPKTEQFKIIGASPARRPFPSTISIKPKYSDAGHEFVSKITKATGGEAFEFTTQQSLATAIQEALANMRSQYSLAYRPSRPENKGAFHRIKIRTTRPGFVTIAREGYRRP